MAWSIRVRLLGSLLVLTLAASLLAAGGVARAASPPLIPGESTGDDPDEDSWEGIVVPDTGTLPEDERHPSLYFDAEDIPTLRARAEGSVPDPNGYYAAHWERVQDDADGWLDAAVSDNDDVKTRAAKALAFAWIITGDVAYRDKAVENLKAAYSDLQQTDQYVAMQMTNYAVAYDWVMADGVADVPPVTAEDDAAMRAAIKVGATWMHDYLDRESVRSHNHRSKVGAAQGSWAMAFSSDPDAQAYLDKGMANLHRVWKYMFTADGIHRDGAGYYWIFTVINSTPFLWHYRNAAGVDLFPALQPAFEWQLKTSNPKGWTPNIEDGWYKTTWLATVAAAYADTPTELSQTGSLGELFQWRFFASDWEPVRYPDDFTGARNQYYGWPDEFVLYDSSLAEVQPDDDTGTIDFDAGPRGGATVFRSDWDYNEARTRWAYFEGTAMSNNHDHADALQFIIDAENTILANDNGFGPQRFAGRNAWKGAEHHNVITADGSALGDPEPTKHFIDTAFFDFAEKEAAYFDDADARHVRGVAFPGQDYFVVVDRLSATTDKTWVSRYHNRGEISGAANRWTWTTEAGPWGDAARMHAFTLPADAEVATASGEFNPYGDGNNQAGPGYPDPSADVEDITKIELTQTGESAQYLKVLVPGPVDGVAPAFHDLSDGDVLGAHVTTGDGNDTFLSQPAAAAGSAGDLEATATFAWSREVGGALQQLSAREATSISFAGEEWAAASQAVSLALDVSDPRRHHGQIARDTQGSFTLRLRLPAGRDVAAATLDGAAVDVTTEDGFAVLELAGGGDLVVEYTAATQAPDAPSDLAAAPFDGRVDLTWTASSGAFAYDVLRSVGDGAPETVATVSAPAHTDTDVVNGTAYSYAVIARNEAGDSAPSDTATATPGLQAPAAPDGLTAIPADSQVSLAWNRSLAADGYHVQRATVSGGPYETVATVTETTYTDTGLDNGVQYHYVVTAANEAGESDASAEVSAQPFTQAPESPTGVRSDRAPGEASLTWSAADRAEHYDVLRATTSGGPYTTVASGLEDTAFTDSDVVDGTPYYYVVVAANASGDSEPSREAVAIPGCTPLYEVDGSTENFIEAEDHAALAGAFVHFDDPDRSGGAYMQSQGGGGSGSAPQGEDFVRFDVHVTEGGSFRLWLLAQGDDASTDSFWIQVDGQEPFQAIMHNSREWRWKTAGSNAVLEGGFHTITIHHRESDARVDKILLTKDDGYTPTGLGEDALTAGACECPDAYPVDGNARTFIEAEGFTETSGDMLVVEDAERSNGRYVQAGPSAPKDDPDTDAWVAYDLDVSDGGEFRILALGYGPDSDSDSFYVAIDDDPPAAQINLPSQWGWKLSSPGRVAIPDGRVRLYIKARKAGSNIDKILLTKDGHTPSGLGDEALSAPGCPDDGDEEPSPTPPAAPTGLSAARGDGQVELAWSAVEDADRYTVLRSDAYPAEFTEVASELEELAYLDTDVEDGVAYTYAIRAVNDDGESTRSATVTAVPGCTPTYELDADAHLWIEAEQPSELAGDMLVIDDEARSGGAHVQVDPDAVKGAAGDDWLRYDLDVAEAGSYAIWLLGYAGGSESSNTFWLQVDGEEVVRANIEVDAWGWRNPATVSLTAGAHTLWLRNREPVAAVDKLLVTADTGFRPAGLGDAADTPLGCGPCPVPDGRPTVVVGDVDTGVPNRVASDGCSINDLLEVDGDWPNHGAFVSHVAGVTDALVESGLLTGREAGAIRSAAARSRS